MDEKTKHELANSVFVWIKNLEQLKKVPVNEKSRLLGKMVKVLYSHGRGLHVTHSLYNITTDFDYEEIDRPATNEDIVEYVETFGGRKEELAQKYEKYLYFGDDVYKIAENIFGEDRVDIIKTYGNWGSIVNKIRIWFPEIDMKNSNDLEHTVRDIVVEFEIDYLIEDRLPKEPRINVSFYGTRLTTTLKEYESRYLHSHLPSSIELGNFNRFCLGASIFGTMISSISIDVSADVWEHVFLSLHNYLSWESLEGGPHIQIANISYTSGASEDQLIRNVKGFISKVPSVCWDALNGVSLIPDHPLVQDCMNKYSKIRSLHNRTKREVEAELATINKHPKFFSWKNKNIPCKVILEDNMDGTIPVVDRELVKKTVKLLNQKSSYFNKYYEYERRKQARKEIVFGKRATSK